MKPLDLVYIILFCMCACASTPSTAILEYFTGIHCIFDCNSHWKPVFAQM